MNWKTSLFLILFSTLLIFLTFNRHRHSKNGYFNYQSEIWADKAGYNVYLPATFIYSFNASAFPDSIDFFTGNGFKLEKQSDIVLTKYTYGVGLLQAPFFLIAYLYSNITGMYFTGYEPIFHAIINISAVFYLVTGLFFLFKFLSFKYSRRTSFISVAIIFLGTNLYYYSIDDTGMSHVYSFFLFSIFLYYCRKSNFLGNLNYSNIIALCILSNLILLIRPTNILFLLIFFLLDINRINQIAERAKNLIKFRFIALFVLSTVVFWLPQLFYWKYATGNYFSYTYGNEGFNFLNPKLFYTWFSPLNGLFLYTPLYLLIVFGMINMIRKGARNSWFILILFLAISFVFSSWWDWSFGCSFGARSFVEYSSVFIMPIAYIINSFSLLSIFRKSFITLFIVVFIVFNLKVTYTYDSCFFGKDAWDWSEYFLLVTSPTK